MISTAKAREVNRLLYAKTNEVKRLLGVQTKFEDNNDLVVHYLNFGLNKNHV